MTITYFPDSVSPKVKIIATEIDDFMAGIAGYTGAKITAYKTCGTPIVQEYNTVDILDNTKLFYIVAGAPNILYITPQLFSGGTVFEDAIYKFEIQFKTATGYIQISNCIFVDITYKCQLAALLQNIIEENKTKTGEKTTTIAHTLHYSLVNASNCGCNCDEMCTVFNSLSDIISNIDPQILSDCGC